MKNALLAGLISFVGLLSGCVASIDPYAKRAIGNTEAVVLVGVDSAIPLGTLNSCSGVCTEYQMGSGRKDILAFPVRVGATFKLTSVGTMDGRVGSLNGEELKVSQRGVYYYGTVVSTTMSVMLANQVAPKLLLAAKRKYGTRFDSLTAMNFTWPDPAQDSTLAFSYRSSEAVQAALKPHAGKQVTLGTFAPVAKSDTSCRMGGRLALPDFLTYEEYVRRAFDHELAQAKLQGSGPGAIALTGRLVQLTVVTFGEKPQWKMGLQLSASDGRQATVHVKVPFEAPWAAAEACPSAEDAVPGAVQKLLEALVASPDFLALLNAPVAAPAQH